MLRLYTKKASKRMADLRAFHRECIGFLFLMDKKKIVPDMGFYKRHIPCSNAPVLRKQGEARGRFFCFLPNFRMYLTFGVHFSRKQKNRPPASRFSRKQKNRPPASPPASRTSISGLYNCRSGIFFCPPSESRSLSAHLRQRCFLYGV